MADLDPKDHDKFRAYRARKRAAGLREIRFWVPDVRSQEFREQSAREAEALRDCAGEVETMAWIDALHEADAGLWD